ncbi:hypothetical protein C8R44DRAFT_882442 [Mycena epipterygia]|nr:hypothetical protein C8R44DRAFT_882442 [Mycena epipterygia]
MSDPAAPPFTQTPAMPELQFNNEGRAWVCHAGGNWTLVHQPSKPTTFDSGSNSAGPAQPGIQHFPPKIGGASTSAGPSQVPASTHPYPHLIDPSLISLPEGVNLNLTDPATIAKSHGHKLALKVAGVRQKTKDSKGKKHHYSSDSDDDTEDEPARKCGCRKGSPNFKVDEVTKLLDLIEKHLPLGQKGWKSVTRRYQKWARVANGPERDGKALENKYKALLKTKKPMSDAHCPPEIKRAHHIQGLINQHAGTRELSNSWSDFNGPADASSDGGSVEILGHSTTVHTPVARRAHTPLFAFDPNTPKSRDDERSQRSFQNTQIFTISQQLRDAQGTIESLSNQITVMQNHTQDVERAHDRAEFKIEMLQGVETCWVHVRPDACVNGKIHCEVLYPDGGACTYWVTDHSSDKSEKKNKDPSPPSQACACHLRSPSPFDLHALTLGPSVASPSTSIDVGMQ